VPRIIIDLIIYQANTPLIRSRGAAQELKTNCFNIISELIPSTMAQKPLKILKKGLIKFSKRSKNAKMPFLKKRPSWLMMSIG
jgi:hypothetical protein